MIAAKTVGINAETATKIVINFLKVGNQNVFIVKNVILSVVLFLTVSFAFAANLNSNLNPNPNENVELEVKITSEAETSVMSIDFSSFEDFNSFDVNQLEIVDSELCTASVSVTVSVGVGSNYVSVTMTADNIPCDEIATTIIMLIARVVAAVAK